MDNTGIRIELRNFTTGEILFCCSLCCIKNRLGVAKYNFFELPESMSAFKPAEIKNQPCEICQGTNNDIVYVVTVVRNT